MATISKINGYDLKDNVSGYTTPELFIINAEDQGLSFSVDKTYAEILAAFISGKIPVINNNNTYISPLTSFYAGGQDLEQEPAHFRFESFTADNHLLIYEIDSGDNCTFSSSEFAAANHDHGNITNGGDITATATIANGDRLVINDESASKVTNSSITFGSSTTTFLANDGTWQTPVGTTYPISIWNLYDQNYTYDVGHQDIETDLAHGVTPIIRDNYGNEQDGVFYFYAGCYNDPDDGPYFIFIKPLVYNSLVYNNTADLQTLIIWEDDSIDIGTETVFITDTKNTAGTVNSTSKLYLVGSTSQAASSLADGKVTYSNNKVYATDGQLDATKMRVAETVTLQYNSTTRTLDFVF